ncbi:reverse transcriptase domain-containing protein [Tanacetum coccineum]
MRFQQRFGETFAEAWDRFKDLLNKCSHHGFSPLHQIDTFYNNLNQSEQDSLNSAANGNFLTKNTQEALTIIENKSKVQTSRNKPQVASASGSSNQDAHITSLTKKVEALFSLHRPVNSIQNGCETYSGPHAYYECQAAGGYTQEDVYDTTEGCSWVVGGVSVVRGMAVCEVTAGGWWSAGVGGVWGWLWGGGRVARGGAACGGGLLVDVWWGCFDGRLVSGGVEGGLVWLGLEGAEVLRRGLTHTARFQMTVVRKKMETPNVIVGVDWVLYRDRGGLTCKRSLGVALFGLRMGVGELTAGKGGCTFLSSASTSSELPPAPVSYLVIPELNPHQHSAIPLQSSVELRRKLQKDIFAKMVKDLLTNKEKLLELANTPLNENCLAVLLKKLPEKLRDTGRFLIPCDFYGLESCMALADLGASINLMPLSMWKTLYLPELSPTRMTLELATRTVAYPAVIAEDVFVQVGKFTFPADFVVVDYEVDPRVPLILGRPFLMMSHALVDVHGEELTIRVGDEKLVFNVESTSKYPRKHDDESIHKIYILDITCEDHFNEVLNVQKSINPMSGIPTLSSDHVVESLSPSFTPFEDSDFLLEETDAFLSLDNSIQPGIDNGIYDSEGILFLEESFNDDPTPNLPPPLPMCVINENEKIKSSIDDPPDLELKDLPPHLEYAFLEGTSKLPGIDPNFCTYKILMKDDFKPAIQHQRRVNPKIHEVIQAEVIKLLDGGLVYPIFDSPWR